MKVLHFTASQLLQSLVFHGSMKLQIELRDACMFPVFWLKNACETALSDVASAGWI